MSEIKEQIVERLREACRDYSGEMIVRGSTPRYEVHCDLLYGAADRIEALEKERDHWKANHAEMVQRNAVLRERPDLPADRLPSIARYEARIKVLEEALRPFARAAQSYDPDEDDGDMDAWDYRPTIGELRFARLALNATPQDGKGGEEW